MRAKHIFICSVCALKLSTAAAQDTQTCDIMAANIPQDVLIQGSSSQQFEAHKSAVCSQENNAWGSASSKTLDGQLTVPGYVDAILGTTSNAQNWGANFSAFCSLDSSTVAASQRAALTVRRVSSAAYAAVVDCVRVIAEQRGIFGALEVNQNRDGFILRVHHRSEGPSEWSITGVTPTPASESFRCAEDLHNASISSPKTIKEATFNIACQKDPDMSVLVAVNTSAGALPPFRLASFDDELGRIMERLEQVEAARVPSGTVAWFNLPDCPTGWGLFHNARGRTIVGAGNTDNRDQRGVLIPNWRHGEVGGEESHLLSVEEMPPHNHGGWPVGSYEHTAAMGNTPPHHSVLNKQIETQGGNVPHNNMPPFVALLPCVKN